MLEKMIKNPGQKIYSTRITMVFVLVLTLISSLLLIINTNIMFPFSLFTPQYFAYVSYLFFSTNNIESTLFYLVMALAVLGLFFYFYRASKNKPKLYFAALILYILDTIFMVVSTFEANSFGWMIDLAFHLWIIYTLLTAVIIVKKGLQNESL